MPHEEHDGLDAIHHIAIAVESVVEAVEWYTARFRCRVAYQDATWALLKFANTSLALVGGRLHPPHFGIMRPDAERFGELKTHRDGLRYVYLEDPSRNTVEVLQEPDIALPRA